MNDLGAMRLSNGRHELIYRDKDGKEISLERFIELFEDMQYRVIGRTRVGSFLVSTVWLGIPHPGGLPFALNRYFESMTFDVEGNEHTMQRYETLGEAKLGHEEMVKAYETGLAYEEG